MRFNLIAFIKGLYNDSIERQLRESRKVKFTDDGFRYPPPSAYEVKQISEEFGLNSSHSMMRVPNNIYKNITKD
jgi:hypothetical protein